MKFRTYSFILLVLLLTPGWALAQDYEYGEPEDLKGLTKYYVNTGDDIKVRRKIVEAIGKKLPNLVLVDDQAESQIRINFSGALQDGLKGGANESGAFLKTVRMPTGTGLVWIEPRGKNKDRPRVIINFTSRQDSKWEKLPHDKFINEFVKAYKKANGL